MPTTTSSATPSLSYPTRAFTVQVAGEECLVRATQIWPIADLLVPPLPELIGIDEMDAVGALAPDDAGIPAEEALSAGLAAVPRRGRRQRAVSSRAMFYRVGDR
ncbi:MAG: hypothetical protein WCJ21_11225 [Planctomycetota bacterium]